MIRTFLLIAGASFVLAVACLAGAAALGGHDIVSKGWPKGWVVDFDDGDHGGHWRHWQEGPPGPPGADGATATREIAWGGGDELDIDAPADVTFTQSAGPAKLTITGPKDVVDRLTLTGPHLGFGDDDWGGPWGGHWGRHWGRVTVTMTAPAVKRFAINGDGTLSIAGYDQDQLELDVSGRGDVTGKGKARAVDLSISGDGDVDLSGLPSDSAHADISGSGRASIAPASAADLHISGSGEIDLATHPAKLSSDVSGSGRIVQGASQAKPN
jgi:hypothetical protein